MEAKLAAARKSRSSAAVAVLSVGAIAALALGLGGIWVARTGIAVAGLAGLGALVLMLRALRGQEVEHREALSAAHERQTQLERRHHVESMGIIERFSARVADLRAQIERLESQAKGLRDELAQRDRLVASMRATQESLLGNAVEMRARIADLEQQIAMHEVELRDLLAAQSADESADPATTDAEIVELPRRPALPARRDDEVVIWNRAVGH